MRIRELQNYVASLLNNDDTLIQNRCKAFAEDSLAVPNTVFSAIQTRGEIGIVVVTPRITSDGSRDVDGISADFQILVRCIEMPALRSRRNGYTALDAAAAVALILDGDEFSLESIDQTANERTGTVTATVELSYSNNLTA